MPRARRQPATPRTTTPGTSSRSSAGGPVQARVLLDTYSWHEEYGNTSSPIHTASKDETITVSQKEFDRGKRMVPTALAKSSEKDVKTADAPIELPKDLDATKEPELRDLATQLGHEVKDDTTRDELVAMVAGAPGHERPQV